MQMTTASEGVGVYAGDGDDDGLKAPCVCAGRRGRQEKMQKIKIIKKGETK